MRILLDVEGTSLAATLENTAVARDFAALLPLDLSLDDYAATERIAYLPRKLTTAGTPLGTAAAVGDIAYYAPWGNLALFYRDSGHAKGLVRLGRLDDRNGVDALRTSAPLRARIEIMKT
ncbi:MAG: cyclophilin-like fold protein [Gemmatimonadaceae bacterium]